MFQAARQKEQESCVFSCLDEITWQCYSRKTIPGTLNSRTILGWTTVRGRIGSRCSYGLLVKENALASEGKSYRPAITAENQYACYHLSLRNKRQKSHFLIFSVKRNPPENNLQAREKNHWNKQHLARGKSCRLPTDPLFTL